MRNLKLVDLQNPVTSNLSDAASTTVIVAVGVYVGTSIATWLAD